MVVVLGVLEQPVGPITQPAPKPAFLGGALGVKCVSIARRSVSKNPQSWVPPQGPVLSLLHQWVPSECDKFEHGCWSLHWLHLEWLIGCGDELQFPLWRTEPQEETYNFLSIFIAQFCWEPKTVLRDV